MHQRVKDNLQESEFLYSHLSDLQQNSENVAAKFVLIESRYHCQNVCHLIPKL